MPQGKFDLLVELFVRRLVGCMCPRALERSSSDDSDASNRSRKSPRRSSKSPKRSSSRLRRRKLREVTLDKAIAGIDRHYSQLFEHRKQQRILNDQSVRMQLASILQEDQVQCIELPIRVRRSAIDSDVMESDGTGYATIETPIEFFQALGYRVVAKLGKGGFGLVLLVEKSSSTEPEEIASRFACKVIALPYDSDCIDGHQFRSIRAELNILENFRSQCPYIIDYYEHFGIRFYSPETECDMMVMHIFLEFADGGTLAEEIQSKGPLTKPAAKRYFYQISEGLAFMHEHHVAHLDLKLDNVLLVTDPENERRKICKLADFGLSKLAFKEGVGVLYMDKFIGTRHYMAPEVIRCWLKRDPTFSPPPKSSTYRPYVPFKADIWSLGICLFILFTAHFPYSVPKFIKTKDVLQFLEIFERKDFINFDFETHFGRCITDLLLRMLEPNPSKRCTIAFIQRHRWLRY